MLRCAVEQLCFALLCPPYCRSVEYCTAWHTRVRHVGRTAQVEHPVLIHAPLEKFEDVQMPLFLTKQEKKRLRKRNRFEAEKEKQDKIRSLATRATLRLTPEPYACGRMRARTCICTRGAVPH